jgi:hypothetical protein
MLLEDVKTYQDLLRKHKKAATKYIDEEITFHTKALKILNDTITDDTGPMRDGIDFRMNTQGGFLTRSAWIAEFMNTLYSVPNIDIHNIRPSDESLKVVFYLPSSKESYSADYSYEMFDDSSKDEEDYKQIWILHEIRGTLNVVTCSIELLKEKIEEMIKKDENET